MTSRQALFTFLPFYLFYFLPFLPFQILFHIRLNLLEFGRELVEGVLLHHHLHLAQTILITCHFGAGLLGMEGTVADFILPIVAQSIADALDDGTYYQVEEMMTLNI